MERWLYKTGTPGNTVVNVPEIAGFEINGRTYRDGIQYRPTQNNNDPSAGKKEYRYDKALGKIHYGIAFFESDRIDIPYEYEE